MEVVAFEILTLRYAENCLSIVLTHFVKLLETSTRHETAETAKP